MRGSYSTKARNDELRNNLSSLSPLKYCLQGYIHDKPHTYGAVHEQSGDAVTTEALHDQDKNDNPARYGNTDIDQLVHITLRISETETKWVTPGSWHLSVCAAE